jgi:hypothetical protein
MDARISRTGWRAGALALITLVAAAMIAIGLPQAAHAGSPICIPSKYGPCAPQKVEQQLAPLSYTGWTRLNLNYCAPGLACAAIYAMSTHAFKWTGKGWADTQLPGGYVYVAPFGGAFRWAYTAQTGWVAIAGERFELL